MGPAGGLSGPRRPGAVAQPRPAHQHQDTDCSHVLYIQEVLTCLEVLYYNIPCEMDRTLEHAVYPRPNYSIYSKTNHWPILLKL